MLGFFRSELVGKTIWEISPFKDIVANKGQVRAIANSKGMSVTTTWLENEGRPPHAVEFVSNVYPAGDRNVIQCNIRDITTRKRAEEQLKAFVQGSGRKLNTEIQNFLPYPLTRN